MRLESLIDRDKLLETICHSYGITAVELEYLPVGFVGRHFIVKCQDDRRFFSTLLDESRLARISAARLPFSLVLPKQLEDKGLFTDLVAPILTRDGKLYTEYQDWPFVLYPYIEGHLLADETPLSNQVQADLGRMVARLHSATNRIVLENPIQEQFQIHFAEQLRRELDGLAMIDSSQGSGKVGLRDLLLPHRDNYFRHLDDLHNMAQQISQEFAPFVICHTDIHPWNIIRTTQGKLVIVDWEGVIVAPPEHDLFIFTGSQFEIFLYSYYQAGGIRELDPKRFMYYFYRRNLEDLIDYITRILYENDDPEIDRGDLKGVQELIDDSVSLETSAERMQDILERI